MDWPRGHQQQKSVVTSDKTCRDSNVLLQPQEQLQLTLDNRQPGPARCSRGSEEQQRMNIFGFTPGYRHYWQELFQGSH